MQYFAHYRRPSQHIVHDYIEELKVKTQCIKTVELEKLIGSDQSNIFFIETNDAITKLHPRLLCAFESAAAHNPTMKVHTRILTSVGHPKFSSNYDIDVPTHVPTTLPRFSPSST